MHLTIDSKGDDMLGITVTRVVLKVCASPPPGGDGLLMWTYFAVFMYKPNDGPSAISIQFIIPPAAIADRRVLAVKPL